MAGGPEGKGTALIPLPGDGNEKPLSEAISFSQTLPVESDNIFLRDGKKITGLQLSEEDMTPESYAYYKKLVMDKNPHANMPAIYLNTQDHSHQPKIQEASIILNGVEEHLLVINSSEHKWSPKFAQKQFFLSDIELANQLASGELAAIDSLAPQKRTEYEQMATRKDRTNLPYAPPLYVNALNSGGSGAQARMTQEGSMYIVIEPVTLAILTPERLEEILGHELKHFKLGITPEKIAQQHNDPAKNIAVERDADKEATGPQGSCRPEVLAQALQALVGLNMKQSGLSESEYYKAVEANDIHHPPIRSRMADLNATAPPEECKKRGR